jgi:hypothetical protein
MWESNKITCFKAIRIWSCWHLTSKGDNTWEYTMVKHICWWKCDHWFDTKCNDLSWGYVSHSSTRT